MIFYALFIGFFIGLFIWLGIVISLVYVAFNWKKVSLWVKTWSDTLRELDEMLWMDLDR